MVEGVGGVVGGQPVVVEAERAAPADDEAAAGLEPQPDLAGDVALGGVDEGVEGLLQRRVPHAVVDEVGEAALEPLLLVEQVALEGERLEVLVGLDEGQRAGRLVGLAALDADPTVLDHVEAAPAVGADGVVQLDDDLVERHRPAVDATPARPPRTR